jgi:flagellar hook-associated protein 1
MPSILDGFGSVQQALAAHQFALSITQRNVANANDPYYTRQDVVYTGDEWEWARSGVQGVSLQAVRQSFIDYSVSRELQSLGEYSVASDALQQIDAVLNGNGSSLQQALSDFFNSFASLSSAPEDLTLRQEVLSSAGTLTTEFHRLYDGIQQVQTSEDRALTYAIDDINSITAQIANLNEQIRVAQAAHNEDEFTLRDSRQRLVEQLSSLVDLSYYETESGSITVATRQGGLLVTEDQSHALQLSSSASGAFRGIFLDGVEITSAVESGKLGGLIEMRDTKIAGYLNALDDLSATIISRVNEQHALGSDLDGTAGGDFFAPFTQLIPGSNYGAARTMTVALTDPKNIAAASAGAEAGNNGNAKLLAAISEEKLFSSSTASAGEFYASLVYRIGTDEATAEESISTQNSVLAQLKNQRDASSGVSLDEEAISIIKYQKAYQASARYANVLNDLSDEILQLLGA